MHNDPIESILDKAGLKKKNLKILDEASNDVKIRAALASHRLPSLHNTTLNHFTGDKYGETVLLSPPCPTWLTRPMLYHLS